MTTGKGLPGKSVSAALTRRGVLKGAAAASLAAPLAGLAGTSAGLAAVARQTNNGSTLILGLDGSPSDLDPQSQYDYRSTMVVRSIYEGLVGLVGSATDEFEGLVAESWEANDDQSVWTFKIRPGLTFHDGSLLRQRGGEGLVRAVAGDESRRGRRRLALRLRPGADGDARRRKRSSSTWARRSRSS